MCLNLSNCVDTFDNMLIYWNELLCFNRNLMHTDREIQKMREFNSPYPEDLLKTHHHTSTS
jgi:hypothetical protein